MGISGPTSRLGGGAGGEVGGEEGVGDWRPKVISNLAEADAAGAKPAVFDLDGTDDQHFALMAAPATAGYRCPASPRRLGSTASTPTPQSLIPG